MRHQPPGKNPLRRTQGLLVVVAVGSLRLALADFL